MTDASMTAASPAARARSQMIYGLCVLGALFEGFDLQAAGITAPRYAPEFHLLPAQVGMTFTANTFGLFVGAVIGGWLADRVGRRVVLVASMALFGIFSIATAYVQSYDTLVAMRLLTGLGLGGAMPNLIAFISEAGSAPRSAMRVTVMTSAIPVGGAIAGLLVLLNPTMSWRTIFHFGGWPPIALALAMLALLPESMPFLDARRARAGEARASITTALFGEGRGRATILLWVAMLGTLTTLYLLLNWFPTLLVGKGYAKPEATLITLVFSLGGAIGSVILGVVLGRARKLPLFVVTYLGMAAALLLLATMGRDMGLALVTSLAAGFFVIGSQFLLYGLTPTYYPVSVRGTGVGSAIAIGRIGAVAGPFLAGQILASGRDAAAVLFALIPILAVALVAVLLLLAWRNAGATSPAAAVAGAFGD